MKAMNERFLLFVKDDCPECNKLKEEVDVSKFETWNVSTVRGMAMASYYEEVKAQFPKIIDRKTGLEGEATASNVLAVLNSAEPSVDGDTTSCQQCRL